MWIREELLVAVIYLFYNMLTWIAITLPWCHALVGLGEFSHKHMTQQSMHDTATYTVYMNTLNDFYSAFRFLEHYSMCILTPSLSRLHALHIFLTWLWMLIELAYNLHISNLPLMIDCVGNNIINVLFCIHCCITKKPGQCENRAWE